MATAAGVITGSTRQGLLRPAARPLARSRLLVRKPRGISGEERARSDQISSARPKTVRQRDQWLLTEFGKPIKTIDQKSFRTCRGPVRLVGSKIKCLCSWNEASGPRQAIYVPGDASRPRKAGFSLSDNVIHEFMDPASLNRSWGYCNPGRGPRWGAWDDPLAALCATDPELKLHDIDVMISVDVLLYLLVVAQNRKQSLRNQNIKVIAFNMSLIGNTLVIKRRTQEPSSGAIQIPSMMLPEWGYFKASTESIPEVEDSSVHYQLLRYKLGPLCCLVRAKVHGTVQEMPTSTSSSERPQTCDLHGIDVIKAGRGVLTTAAFGGVPRPPPRTRRSEFDLLHKYTAGLWFSGLNMLGIADIVPAGKAEGLGGLAVVEMGELVRQFEDRNQSDLCRLVGLLMTLRAAVRAHGAPCVGVFWPRRQATEHTDARPDYTLQVHSAGPEEAPVLLDWHKKHFWSLNRAPSKRPRPRVEPSNGHPQRQKSIIGKLAKWLGF